MFSSMIVGFTWIFLNLLHHCGNPTSEVELRQRIRLEITLHVLHLEQLEGKALTKWCLTIAIVTDESTEVTNDTIDVVMKRKTLLERDIAIVAPVVHLDENVVDTILEIVTGAVELLCIKITVFLIQTVAVMPVGIHCWVQTGSPTVYTTARRYGCSSD